MTFESLSYDQQLARLTQAAQDALSAYGLDGAQITPLMYISNAVFRVDHHSGHYALRLARPALRDAWLRSELALLEAITRDTDLCVPRPVRTLSGEPLALAPVADRAEPLRAALLTWVEGESIAPEALTLDQAGQMGAFLARLHHYSARFQPPPGFERPRLDWEGLFGQDSPYNPGAGAAIFTPGQTAVFDQVAAQVRAVMDELGTSPAHFGLIHADFIAKNILFHQAAVCALDFDNCAFGCYLYDLAPPLLQWSALPHYAALRAALWHGYTGLRPLPQAHRDHLETFIAGRHVASCRWIASNLDNPKIRARAPQIIAERVGELRGFLQTGRLERRSEQF
jgi:Ser/Thr protein kinase RdoA (MazF antagonist)